MPFARSLFPHCLSGSSNARSRTTVTKLTLSATCSNSPEAVTNFFILSYVLVVLPCSMKLFTADCRWRPWDKGTGGNPRAGNVIFLTFMSGSKEQYPNWLHHNSLPYRAPGHTMWTWQHLFTGSHKSAIPGTNISALLNSLYGLNGGLF